MAREDARLNRLAELAVELRLSTPALADRALAACARGEASDPAEWLERQGLISASQRALLEQRAGPTVLTADTLLENATSTALQRPPSGPPTNATLPARTARGPRTGAPAQPAEEPGGEALAREHPGRYTIRYLHASGGQARILLAHDNHLGRDVALKEISPDDERPEPGSSGSSAEMQRLLREARVTGQLEHPNIVPVYDLGQRKDGSLYYTMRFVRGVTLSQRLAACKDLRERLRLLRPFLDICSAVAYAHSRGVIHRDLKPSNAMVGEFGETVLLDWGIAKVRGRGEIRGEVTGPIALGDDGQVQTVAGAAIGTPGYMSPEQALGKIEDIDERSDVWGLGAMLYQILTGRAPNSAKGEAALLSAGEGRVIPPRKLCPEAPPELAAIAEKALQRDKARRYQGAKELADEVEAYMTGGRVGAYRYSSWELLTRFAQQNKRAMAAAAVILLVIIGALVAVSISYSHERQARQDQAAARGRENQERLAASYHLAGAYYQKAERLKSEFRFISAAGYAAQSLVHNPVHPRSPRFSPEFAAARPAGRELAVAAASTVYQTRFHDVAELAHVFEAKEVLSQAAFSDDGSMIAAGCYDHAVYVWDPDTRLPPRKLTGHSDRVTAVAFAHQRPMLASGSRDGQVIIWNAATGEKLHELPGTELVRSLAFSPDGALLAAAGRDKLVRLWAASSGELVAELAGHEDEVFAVAFSPNGATLASAGGDKLVRLWNLKTRKVEATFTQHATRITALAFAPDGRSLASAGDEKTVHIVSLATGRPAFSLEGHGDAVNGVAWSPDGRFIATSSFDKTANLWDAKSGSRVVTLEGHTGFVNGVAFSARGDRLVSVGNDRTLRLWRLKRDAERMTLAGHSQSIYGVAFSPDGRRIATASWDKTVRLWETATRRQLFVLKHDARVDRLAFGPDGVLLASCAKDRKVRVWDAREGALYFEREIPEEPSGIAFSPDGQTVAVSAGNSVRLFDVGSRGRDVRVLQGHEMNVTDVAFSPDGRRLATSGQDRLVLLWDFESGKVLKVLSGHADWVWSVRFSANGRRLVSAGREGIAILWDLEAGVPERKLIGHRQWVNSAQFSSDGRFVATGSDDRTARIWDSATGEPLLIFDATQEVAGLSFSPGARLLAVADGNAVMLYPIDFSVSDADPEKLLRDAKDAGFKADDFGTEPVAQK